MVAGSGRTTFGFLLKDILRGIVLGFGVLLVLSAGYILIENFNLLEVSATSNSPDPTPSPTPVPTASPLVSPSPSFTTTLKLCKYEDLNANGIRDTNDSVLSWKFTVWISGENARIIESDRNNSATAGCALIEVPVDRTITVEEEGRSGWRLTKLYANEVGIDGSSFIYGSRNGESKNLWFLNSLSTGGTVLGVTTNTQPECVSLSANPTTGGATLPVSLMGKGRDLDGIIKRMEFNFGDGDSQVVDIDNGETNRDTLRTISHTYKKTGTYVASIRVKDNSGQENEWSATPESCKVKIDVQGTVLGTNPVQPLVTQKVTELPKSGISGF
ncbi:MAG: PKD domain-containing protein [Patescibacteria group bacterium]